MRIKTLWLGGGLAVLGGCASVPDASLNVIEAPVVDSRFEALKPAAIAAAVNSDGPGGAEAFVGETQYVYLSNFQFDPNVLHLKSGTLTRIHLNNIAWVTHYFGGEEFFRRGAEVVDILGSDVPTRQHHIPVSPFSSRDLYLFIKQPGEYPLSCFVPSHRAEGMTGTLIVEP